MTHVRSAFIVKNCLNFGSNHLYQKIRYMNPVVYYRINKKRGILLSDKTLHKGIEIDNKFPMAAANEIYKFWTGELK